MTQVERKIQAALAICNKMQPKVKRKKYRTVICKQSNTCPVCGRENCTLPWNEYSHMEAGIKIKKV